MMWRLYKKMQIELSMGVCIDCHVTIHEGLICDEVWDKV